VLDEYIFLITRLLQYDTHELCFALIWWNICLFYTFKKFNKIFLLHTCDNHDDNDDNNDDNAAAGNDHGDLNVTCGIYNSVIKLFLINDFVQNRLTRV
jgi:hypothetical protein